MIRGSKLWWWIAVPFLVINVGGAPLAAAQGEALHAAGHFVALLLGAPILWWFSPWRRRAPEISGQPGEFDDRLTHLEQTVDAVAIEVERIGEGQRFITRLFTESSTSHAHGERVAEPIELDAR